MTGTISISSIFRDIWREKLRSPFTILSARRADFSIRSVTSIRRTSVPRDDFKNSMPWTMIASGFLTSWATPAATAPSAANFSDWMNCFWVFLFFEGCFTGID